MIQQQALNVVPCPFHDVWLLGCAPIHYLAIVENIMNKRLLSLMCAHLLHLGESLYISSASTTYL